MAVTSNTYFRDAISLVASMLTFTFCFVLLAAISPSFEEKVLTYVEPLLLLGSCGSLASVLALVCSSKKTHTHVAIFTVFETMAIVALSMLYSSQVVLMATVVTGGVSAGLWVYALTTDNDHTNIGGVLYSILTGLLFMGLLNMFFQSALMYRLELYMGTIVFMGYIIFDVQYFLKEKVKEGAVSDALHIDAAMNIYLDIINLFVRILPIIAELMGENNGGRVARRRRDKDDD